MKRLLIVILLLFLFASCMPSQKTRAIDYKLDVYFPYLGQDADIPSDDIKVQMQDNGIDYYNYVMQACMAITHLYYYGETLDSDSLAQAKEIIDCCMDTFERYGYFPRPPYEELEYGWVSSMDAPTIAVASQMFFEITKKTEYRDFVNKLIQYSMKDVENNGFNIELSNGTRWPLEYADKNANEEVSRFVNNGSLLGWLGLKIIAEVTESNELMHYCDEALQSYKLYADRFRFGSYGMYYMLNPKAILPPHYLIFEKQLFEAAYSVSKEDFFQEEGLYREMVLERILGLEFKSTNKETSFTMNRASAPHPYSIDIYGTRIDFLDKDQKILQSYTQSGSGNMENRREEFYDSMFLSGTVPKGALTYRIYSETAAPSYLLFESEINMVDQSPLHYFDGEISYSLDCIKQDEIIVLDEANAENVEGRITLTNITPEPLDYDAYYCIEIESFAEHATAVALLLYDTEGIGSQRYYTTIVPGKNLIVYSLLGFTEVDQLKNINSVTLRLYTNNYAPKEKAEFKLGAVCQVNSLFELNDYIMQSKYTIHPQ